MQMPIRIDPDNNETPDNFNGQRVLEIGCGSGRLTWRYADQAAHVVGIDSDSTVMQVVTPPPAP
jgi:2-polyprenyl-3-methyl-5-hydroxy-6-metoxy-1,4-benzoquinol methylase